MKVRDLMVREVRTCGASDDLARAAQILWDRDCGIVPVVSLKGRVEGVVTDRDICMAAYTQGLPLGSIGVDRIMTKAVFTCSPEDSAETALRVMSARQVRRLPVVDEDGKLVGIFSLNDAARAARARPNPDALAAADVAAALAAIGKPRAAARSPVGSIAARQADVEC